MITICGVQVNAICKGNGKTSIVLLHGWGQNYYMMKFIQDYFSEQFTVLNMDLPGFGESEEPKDVWNIDKYADFLHEVIQYFDLDDVILIAHSFGARIALKYSLRYPVKKMLLTGAAGIQPKRGMSYWIKVKTYKFLKTLSLAPTMGSNDYRNASEVMRGILVAGVEENLLPILKDIDVETLLVWGEKDVETPLWMGKEMETRMQNASLVILKQEGHFAYFHCSMQFLRIAEVYLKE